MTYRIKRVSVAQMTGMLTALHACMGLIFVPFFVLASVVDPELRGLGLVFGIVVALFLPVLYAVMGAISGAVGSVLYNWIAGLLGGIEMELDGTGSTLGAPPQVSD